ncbi:ArnT family glycosyltransferase [Streptomyces sp. NPDC002324]
MTSATDPYPHTGDGTEPVPTPPTPTPASEPPPPATSVRPPEAAPRWSLPALIAIMVLAAVLYSWNLSSSGLNSFYSAAVLSGTQSWKAWFFGSLDAGNFLTVDKPPFVLMVMGLSCRVFGFGTWQMMAPLIASALGTLWILHSSVKRVWGHGAAAVAALVLALTPITVAINRDNNPDTLLVFLMVAGAALALRAVRDGRLPPLLGSAVCFGLAFNTKMLQGYIALPAVFAVYLYAADTGLLKRIANLALAGVALAVSSFWWAAAVSLVPADERPYIGGSTDGTAWNLIMGYNGLGRILGGEGNGGGGGGGGGGFSGTAGLGRMFNDTLGGQISWLLPFSAVALIGGLVLCGRAPRTDPTRAALVMWGGWTALHHLTFSLAEGTMHPYYTTALAPGIAALCGGGGLMLLRAFRADRRWLWVLPAAFAVTGVWAVVLLRRATDWNTWLWPAVAVVMAVAVVGLTVFRSGGSGTRVRLLAASLTAAVVASVAGPAAYAATELSATGGGMGGTNPTAGPTTGNGMGGFGGGGDRAGGGGPGGGGFPGGQNGQANGQQPGGSRTGTPPGGGTGTGAPPSGAPDGTQQGGTQQGGQTGGQAAPQGGTSGGPGGGTGGGMGGGGMGGGVGGELITYLKKNQDGAKWLLAVASSQSAAQLVLSSGEPVISMWGWSGSDRAMTLARLKELVEAGELHYIQLGGGMGGRGGDSGLSSEVTAWVRENGTAVDASEYGGSATSDSTASSAENSESASVYRLDPSDVK